MLQNYRLVRYIDGKNDTPDIHNIGSKELTNGYYIVPVSSNDDIEDLDGNDVVAIEKCVDNVCNVVDVYGIPNYGSDDDLKKHDFTDGRAYRLQGPVHDSPKQTWVKNDWVIVKPLKGNKTTRASRNDFELIITEVTDPKDDKKRFVELYSPSGHINYSIIEVSVYTWIMSFYFVEDTFCLVLLILCCFFFLFNIESLPEEI